MQHSPEPWKYCPKEDLYGDERDISDWDWTKLYGAQKLIDKDGTWILSACSCCEAVNAKPIDMKRIELCVNYCTGMTDEELETAVKLKLGI